VRTVFSGRERASAADVPGRDDAALPDDVHHVIERLRRSLWRRAMTRSCVTA
jgi:hypothetical protein